MPSTFREACVAPTSQLLTLGDLGALSVEQKAAILICDGKRAGVVEIIDGVNAAAHPKPWFRLW